MRSKEDTMHVGIVGPCTSGPLSEFLPESKGVDIGWGGYPVVNLVRALISRGHRVSVVTLSPNLTERRILKGPRLTYFVSPTRTNKRMRDLFKVERQGLKESIDLAKPDILHAHWTYEFALACLETGLPTLITCHDNAFRVLRFSQNLYGLGRLYLQIRVLRKARFLTAVSPYLANSLGWLSDSEINVIPNIVEVVRDDVNKCGEESGRARIATVLNGWQDLKNPKAAIEAFNLLLSKRPDAEMFMYGYGFEEGGSAAQWAASEDLSQNIHFCGLVPHDVLHGKLKEMSILLHPALEEACPMALLEAMALGVPVVAGIASGAVPWVLDEGRAGFLTDVRSAQKIADTLLACIEQAEDRKRRQKNAYERVLTFFSPDSVAAQYEKLYQRVLSSH